MCDLISGKEAKLAWASGEDVEYFAVEEWRTICGSNTLGIFDRIDIKFRTKPKTIKLELEIPAPFEPKDGEECWILNESVKYRDGYKLILSHDSSNNYIFGAWRTEEEIKQVVAALRSIKK